MWKFYCSGFAVASTKIAKITIAVKKTPRLKIKTVWFGINRKWNILIFKFLQFIEAVCWGEQPCKISVQSTNNDHKRRRDAILCFRLFYKAELDKTQKQMLLLEKWSDFDENPHKTSLYQYIAIETSWWAKILNLWIFTLSPRRGAVLTQGESKRKLSMPDDNDA